MENLDNYIAFDLEFNTVDDRAHLIQVSAVRFVDHVEVASFDTYVHTDVPLKSFINGLTGITADKIAQAPRVEKVLAGFRDFVGDTPLIGYNAEKSDLPILLENGLDLSANYRVDVFDQAYERRSRDLPGIANLQLHTVATFLNIQGKSHDSLEDARMTALVYEKFLEFDETNLLVNQQVEDSSNNPFAALGLGDLFD